MMRLGTRRAFAFIIGQFRTLLTADSTVFLA